MWIRLFKRYRQTLAQGKASAGLHYKEALDKEVLDNLATISGVIT
jgi:hypothetical protein